MKFFEKLILIEKRKRKAQEMSDDEIERDQADRQQTDRDAEDEEEAETGQAVEMREKKDKDWIQKAVNPDHEGYCTPMTKATCTPKRKALAKTFKKMGRERDRKIKAKDEK